MPHRLFVALKPPPAILSILPLLQGGVSGARWQTEEQFHITLRFIGEVERWQAEEVAQALAGLGTSRFPLRLSGVGQFGSGDRVNALWAGVAPHDAISALHRKIDAALARAGLEPEGRAYLPHLTLARMPASTRFAAVESWLAQHAGFDSPAFEADAMILFESSLGKGGAHYRQVARWPLV